MIETLRNKLTRQEISDFAERPCSLPAIHPEYVEPKGSDVKDLRELLKLTQVELGLLGNKAVQDGYRCSSVEKWEASVRPMDYCFWRQMLYVSGIADVNDDIHAILELTSDDSWKKKMGVLQKKPKVRSQESKDRALLRAKEKRALKAKERAEEKALMERKTLGAQGKKFFGVDESLSVEQFTVTGLLHIIVGSGSDVASAWLSEEGVHKLVSKIKGTLAGTLVNGNEFGESNEIYISNTLDSDGDICLEFKSGEEALSVWLESNDAESFCEAMLAKIK